MTLIGKRILIVLETLDLGGAERQALLLAGHLQRKYRAELVVCGFSGPGTLSAICDRNKFAWHPYYLKWPNATMLSYLSTVKKLFKFVAFIRKLRPSVILPYCILPNVICGLVWRFTGASLCLWNQRDEGVQRLPVWAERIASGLTPIFVVNSFNARHWLEEDLGVASSRIHLVPNGVHLNRPLYSPDTWRNRLALTPETFCCCMIANLHSLKDHATLLKAWKVVQSILEERDIHCALLLAGRGGKLAEQLKAQAKTLEITSTVHFLGYVEDIAGLLQIVDLCILSSNSEGCPNSLLEAMAAGIPVVASNIQGVRDAVGEENSPFLFTPGNENELAGIILAFSEDRSLSRSAGEVNRRIVERDFKPDIMCDKMVAIISESMKH
jgi:glycosyltransferase involved in cell wall biosynthesis